MSNPVCSQCRHFREQPRPVDPHTGATEVNGRPREGQCFRGPPQFATQLAPQGILNQLTYPPLPPDFPACDQFTARAEPATDPDQTSDWWNAQLRHVLDARRQGNDFAAGCLLDDCDQRLRQAGNVERRHLVECLLGMYARLDREAA